MMSRYLTVCCLIGRDCFLNDWWMMIIVLTSRETLVRRPEFCLVINKLRKSCGGFKADGLSRHYPGLCDR